MTRPAAWIVMVAACASARRPIPVDGPVTVQAYLYLGRVRVRAWIDDAPGASAPPPGAVDLEASVVEGPLDFVVLERHLEPGRHHLHIDVTSYSAPWSISFHVLVGGRPAMARLLNGPDSTRQLSIPLLATSP